MKKPSLAIAIAIAAISANSALSQSVSVSQSTVSVSSTGSSSSAYSISVPQPQYPFIILQPVDLYVPFGATATFSVTALNANGYQWLCNGNALPNATNSSLVISNAQIQNVSYYSCDVFKGLQSIPTRSALLAVYTNSIDPQTGVDPLVVYSFPYPGCGSGGSCPGPFIGYVEYAPGTNYWGWLPQTTNGNTTFTATDENRTNTKIQYAGEWGDVGCAQTTIAVPYPAFSPQYQFCIYFTNNVPTNAYPITLYGFYP